MDLNLLKVAHRRQLTERGDVSVSGPIEVQRFEPRGPGALDIIGHRITDHQRGARLHFQSPTSLKVGLSVRLRMAHLHGGEELNAWQVEPACPQFAHLHVSRPIREHTDLEP